MKKNLVTFFCIALILPLWVHSKEYEQISPNGKLQLTVTVDQGITIALKQDGIPILNPSSIAMTLGDGTMMGGEKAKVIRIQKKSIQEKIKAHFYKKDVIDDVFNALELKFRGNYSLIFRLYDDGMAYRFSHKGKRGKELLVKSELASYIFPSDFESFGSHVNSEAKTFNEQYYNSFESTYSHHSLTKQNSKRLFLLPFLMKTPEGKSVCITEADLNDYPGMYLNNNPNHAQLNAFFAPYPKELKQGGHNMLQMEVITHENYLAKTVQNRSFPWRVFIVTDNDVELANTDMVYKLAEPSRLSDCDWIKPGKVAWDWWNDWNIYGIDFRAGINNDTYKYYIDFAAEHHIEYVILDEGWATNLKADMLDVIPEINLQELVDYGKERKVGIILWAGYYAFERDMENVVKHYAAMGVKGFKVDFMNRDDQLMVNFLYKAAKICSEHKMMVDFHGIYKPTGLNRTYPNVINYEAVFGLENMKWSPKTVDMVTHDVTLPFVRMIAGPMDYTQGAMKNVIRANYSPVWSEPMSQGTRCHQLGMYVVFESPLNMLCDNPSNYKREAECVNFMANVPTTWDASEIVEGEVAKYIVTVRRKGKDWFVGGLNNWDAREVTVDLSFLPEGNYKIELFKDGINADRAGRDYKRVIMPVPANKKLVVKMSAGGGFAARIF